MLKHWQTHAEYQQFISEAVASLNPSQLKKLHSMSDSWCKLTSKKAYNNRTSSERVNNRILNNYHLHDMKIHGKKRYSFFAMIAGINIHLDARLKKIKTGCRLTTFSEYVFKNLPMGGFKVMPFSIIFVAE